jgi:hypothetical protein
MLSPHTPRHVTRVCGYRRRFGDRAAGDAYVPPFSRPYRECTAIMNPIAVAQMPPNTIHSAQWSMSKAAA